MTHMPESENERFARRRSSGGVAGSPTIAAAAVLVAAVLAAYAPVYRAGFIWDDDDYVIENETLRDAPGLVRIWADPGATPQYYPLVHTTFWIEHQLWGLKPAGYHVTNVLLHAAAAVLLWRILALLGVRGAWLAAAVFALHPVHVESVAWITERKNVLSGAFGLGAFWIVCRFLRLGGGDSTLEGSVMPADWRLYAAATLSFVAALLSKTVLCSLPVVVWLVVWWRRGRVRPFEVAVMLPWLLLGAVSGLGTAWLEKMHVGAAGGCFELSPFERIVIAGRAVLFYWEKLLWPHPLAFMYPRWDPASFTAADLAYPIAVVVVVALLAAAVPRIGRGPLAAVLGFLVTAFPALGFISVYPMRYTFVADHYQYLASVPVIVLAVAAASTLTARWPFGFRAGAAGGALCILAGCTAAQARIYENLETLWTDTLAKNPRCAAAHFHLGKVRLAQGRPAEAARLFADSERLEVDHSEADIAETFIANALVRDGRPGEALPHYEAALEKNPLNVEALNGLANLHARYGGAAAAIPLYRRALAERPGESTILTNLGNALAKAGDVDAAIEAYREAVSAAPANGTARVNLAVALARRGRLDEAAGHLREALRIEPGNAAARDLLGRLNAEPMPPSP